MKMKNEIPGFLTLQLFPTDELWQDGSGNYVMGYSWIKLTDGWQAVEVYPPIVPSSNTGVFNITWNPDSSLSGEVPSLTLGGNPPTSIGDVAGTPVQGGQYNWGNFGYPGVGNYRFLATVTAGGKTYRVDPEMIVGDGQGSPLPS